MVYLSHAREGRVFPRQFSDRAAFVFVSTMTAATFVYELAVVLPSLYSFASLSYMLHASVGLFLLINICGNFYGLWRTDTSTRGVILSTQRRWQFCIPCQAVQPPRAWHCVVCNVCVLKREHHCIFVGYCVGHRNHRFFCLFLVYMCISVLYCTYFNTHFLSTYIDSLNWTLVLKFVFPLMSLLTLDLSWLQVNMFFWSVHFAASLLTLLLILYHALLILNGKTTYENNSGNGSYNLGWRQNLLEVFGSNWRKIIFWPFGRSKLPHDGINWDTTETWKLEGPKSR